MLRKKPEGKLLRGAHQVEREFEAMNALHKVDFPVPRPLFLDQSAEYLSTPFYVMEFVQGRVFREMSLPGLSPAEKTEIYRDLGRVLAKLHSFDPKKIGLGHLSKSNTKYLRRNIRAWYGQFKNSPTKDSTTELVSITQLSACSARCA